jgi:large subunit ribosomal protein L21
MYAVIVNSGQQYRVKEGQILNVAKIELEPGDTFSFDQVLMVVDGNNLQIGKPYLQGIKITASIEAHGRDKKVKILKFRRRKHYMKRMGHRQWFTKIKINSIEITK